MLFVEDTRFCGKVEPQYLPSMEDKLESPSKMVKESKLKLFFKIYVLYHFFFLSEKQNKKHIYLQLEWDSTSKLMKIISIICPIGT